jgi:hypothetical protein
MQKKRMLITLFFTMFILSFSVGCQNNKRAVNVEKDYQGIENSFNENNFKIKNATSFGTDFLPNITGYTLNINKITFYILHMPLDDFNKVDINDDFLINEKKVYAIKNNNKPYLIYTFQDSSTDKETVDKILKQFTEINIPDVE